MPTPRKTARFKNDHLSPEMLAERSKQMADMYMAGNTLVVIGVRFQLSRERVRQILRRDYPAVLDSVPAGERRYGLSLRTFRKLLSS